MVKIFQECVPNFQHENKGKDLDRGCRTVTRLFDIVFSGIALILMSPLFLPIIIALRLTGEGEIFYKQVRIGRGGESFNLLKFATMLKDSPQIGAGNITLADDPRVLHWADSLRKSKINELPQLVNILVGQMSVIGPRPITPDQGFEKLLD